MDAITYKWAIECPAGSTEHRGRPGRGFCHSLGHGKLGFQSRGQKRHLTSDCVMTDWERKPPAHERRGARKHPSAEELSRLIFPAVLGGRYCHSPLVQMRKLSQRTVGLPEVALLPRGRTRFRAGSSGSRAHAPSGFAPSFCLIFTDFVFLPCGLRGRQQMLSGQEPLAPPTSAQACGPTLTANIGTFFWLGESALPVCTTGPECQELASGQTADGQCLNTPAPRPLWRGPIL